MKTKNSANVAIHIQKKKSHVCLLMELCDLDAILPTEPASLLMDGIKLDDSQN